MPYPNEHSARLRDPNDFDPKTYRRTAGGTIYGKVKVPRTIGVIWAKLKEHNKPKDAPQPQALRFPIKNWTVDNAKKWLKDNNVKYLDFEPAKGEEKHSLKNKTETREAPEKACVFNFDGEVSFAEQDKPESKDSFKMVCYDGSVMLNHFFWGNLALDLAGLKFSKDKLPILEEHFTDKRIGFSTKQEITDKVLIEGTFLDNPKAKELQQDMAKGFPMEASLRVMPTSVELVKDGESVEVNGNTLGGPGAVFRKATIKEASICPLGAFDNTSTIVAGADNKNVCFNIVCEEKIMDMTIDILREQYPDLVMEIQAGQMATGEKKERDLFAELEKVCGTDYELLIQCYKEGKTTVEAQQMLIAKLQKQNTDLQTKLAEKPVVKPEPVKKVDPAVIEFTDDASKVTPIVDPNSEEGMRATFAASQELKNEFKDEKIYLAYRKAEKAGQVKICGNMKRN